MGSLTPRVTRPARRDHYITPTAGADARGVLDGAVESLCSARHLDAQDPTARLHALASLVLESDACLHSAVADSRRYGCSWAEVGDLVGVSRASAWSRFAASHADPA